MHLLIADDDEKLLDFLDTGLRQEGHTSTLVHDGREAFDHLKSRHFDAAVLDIMMPSMDGFEIIRSLRAADVKIPVLILSAKRDVNDRVKGLRLGGDDYLVKPFSLSELLARLEAIHRRTSGQPGELLFEVGDLRLDVVKREVTRCGRRIELQAKEYALLEYLVRNANRVVSKTVIMEKVWGYQFDPQTNVVEARLSLLRDKIDEPFDSPLIHTVRGVGYILRAE